MKIQESNVTVNVKDLNKSVHFYNSIGLTLQNRWGNYYAQMTAPGIVIGLHPTSDKNLKGNSGNASIGFIADNFDEVRTLLKELSISTSEAVEEGGTIINFSDPDGTALYFIKPKW